MAEFNLEEYLAKGVEKIVKKIVQVSLPDVKTNSFMISDRKHHIPV